MKIFRSFRLDTENQCLWRGQKRVPVPPKAYDVLRYLVENSGTLVTPDELHCKENNRLEATDHLNGDTPTAASC